MNRNKSLTYLLALIILLLGLACVRKESKESFKRIIDQVEFNNVGTVTKGMVFDKSIINGFYVETDSLYSTIGFDFRNHDYHDYLFLQTGGEKKDPPSGMRSSVPLGGLGAGSVELRADGSFMDWNIFNNSPATTNVKVQLKDAFMGLYTKQNSSDAVATTLRTHPPKGLPAIDEITYSGAFPVSKLELSHAEIDLNTNIYAYSEFRIRNPEQSAAPCTLFTIELINPTDEPYHASFLFNLPNHIKGDFNMGKNGLVLSKSGKETDSGNMTLAAKGADMVTYQAADEITEIWNQFSKHGQLNPRKIAKRGKYGAISAQVNLLPHETRMVTIAMGWYFPEKPIGAEIVGNYYTNLYQSSTDVTNKTLNRLPEIWDGILEWNRTCFDNTLPGYLQDAMVNSMATMVKTGIWTKDGRFRQWESFACPNIDPIHIHFARALPYELFFPKFKQSIIGAHGRAQRDNGYIPEKLMPRSPGLVLDNPPPGRVLGDCSTSFILSVYMTYKWINDTKFVDEMWPRVKKAMQWQMNRSKQFGLPERMASTYDLSGFGKKDLVSYNAFMHMASLKATMRLAMAFEDEAFAKECQKNLEIAEVALMKYLWTGTYFRNWWSQGVPVNDDLHIDSQYGQLWSYQLGLGNLVDPNYILSHLDMEEKEADSPYGLQVLAHAEADRDETGSGVNTTVWQAGSIHWSIINMYLNNDADNSLHQAEKVIDHWREKLNDQWNYADLTSVSGGYPHTNSHYGRQLMLWGIPLAMVGQDYDAINGVLALHPKVKAPYRLPIFTPKGNALLEAEIGKPLRLKMISGELELREVVFEGETVANDFSMSSGDTIILNKKVSQFD